MIKPLFKTISQTDFKAMRFQKDLLETSLAKLSDEKKKFETLRDNLIEQIGELPLSVNIVSKEETLIKQAQRNNYWAKATDDTFDELSEKLSSLMKYRDGKMNTGGPARFDLIDSVKTKETVEFGPEYESVSISRYREMVVDFIMELTANNPVLQKIKDGKDISEEEVNQLATMLNDDYPYITEDLLRNIYKNRKAGFIQFIRHILGLEILKSFPETVEKAFEQFIQAHTNLTSRQMEFLNLLKEYIVERETVKRRDLIEAPFTLLHPQGIRGIFHPAEINEILELTERLAL